MGESILPKENVDETSHSDFKKENLIQKSFRKQFDSKLQVDCRLKNVSFLVEGRVDSLHLGQNLTGLEFGKFCH